MTIRDRVFIVIGLACGVLLASAYRKRAIAHTAQPVDTFADEMMQRTAELNKQLVQIKQDRQDDKRVRRLGNGT